MYQLIRPEWIGMLPELFLTTCIMYLIIYGVIYQSQSTLGYKVSTPVSISSYHWLILQTLFSTQILSLNNFTYTLNYTGLFNHNYITTLLTSIIILITIGYFIAIQPLVRQEIIYNFEYYIIILCSLLGMTLLIKSNDLLALYLSIELLSLSLYVLAAYRRTSLYGTESGLKYYVIGGFASCILLLGIAIIYGITGLTSYSDLIIYNIANDSIVGIGYFLIISALIFKLGGAPYHMWLPDVYQGASLGSTAYFSIVPKLSIVYALTILLQQIHNDIITLLITIISILSLTIGTLQALGQINFKRLLAYSTISHVGFILIGITNNSGLLYTIIYMIMTLGIFIIIIGLKDINRNSKGHEYYIIENIKNLGIYQPMMAISLAIILFSMAGVPPLSGFYIKFYVLLTAISGNNIILAIIAILASSIAAVYYLKLIQLMYFYQEDTQLEQRMNYPLTKYTAILLSITVIAIIFMFIKTNGIISILETL